MKNDKTKNKFDELNRVELLRICLEQEAELEIHRPKPPKFKLGQLVAYYEPKQVLFKHPWMPGQPAVFFTILSLELKNGDWFYGHTRVGNPASFALYPEKKVRELTKTELDGSDAPVATEPQSTQAEAPGLAAESDTITLG